MSQLFIDSASITNLIISNSYIGSSSTSFNKENSFLRTNNGVRQGILNGNFNTADATYSHIEGYSNSGLIHVEGANNTSNSSAGGHLEGYNNTTSNLFQYSHIEGTNNYSSDSNVATLSQNHVEGGFNTLGGGWGKQHLEGYNNKAYFSSVNANHVEGADNKVGNTSVSNIGRVSHTEGYNNSLLFNSYHTHIEGAEHSSSFTLGYGRGNHIEGRANALLSFTNGNSTGNHLEGYNNSFVANSSTETNGNHICGISCSSYYTNNNGSFINGLRSQTYYTGSYSFISGQFNTSNLSNYSNITPTTNRIWSNFTIGGGLNDNTRANIFEVTLISSASAITVNPTRSIILPWVSESGEFADDTAAATGGIPLGGFYRTGNSLKIRLS
jgi:hypothetical protein